MSDNNDYNVYNTFDSNFINYGELYKTPREMKTNTKDLIGDYADALIKGSSEVYENSPDLVGNRYFIDTNTLCLDKDDNTKTHNRSVLVDNVLTSTIDMAKDGNRGLMYSLLGSLKTMNSNTMYDMSNNEPISYDKKNPTEYLKNINEKPMPLCSKVSVYAGDDKDSGIISGYVTKDDLDIIDPKAKEKSNIVEGMVGAPPITVNGNMTAKEFGSGIDKQQKVITAHQEAIAAAQTSATTDATSNAKGALDNAKNSAKKHGNKVNTNLNSATSSSIKTQKGRAESAKAAGASNQLIKATSEYLSTPPPTGAFGLKCGDTISTSTDSPGLTKGIVSALLNVKYPCGSSKKLRRIPYQCVDEIGKRFQNMSQQKSKDFKKYGNNICSNKDKFKNGYSVPKFFKGLSQLLRENAYNDSAELNTSDIPYSPPMSIEVRVFSTISASMFFGRSRTVGKCETKPSLDYQDLYGQLDKSCLKEFATLITRYNDVSAFGNCSAIKDDDNDGFIDKMFVPCANTRAITFLDSTAYFYMITLFFLILYMIYKFMLKMFHFDKLMPMTPKKSKK